MLFNKFPTARRVDALLLQRDEVLPLQDRQALGVIAPEDQELRVLHLRPQGRASPILPSWLPFSLG